MRTLLRGTYRSILWSDIRTPDDLAPDEPFVAADLSDLAAVEKLTAGIDGIVHLGGHSVEGPWETILSANIVGCYNVFEAARRQGVKRIVFASSNHAVGFYPRTRKIGVSETVRPDSRYGVSKAFGEALGALYAYKHGLRVTCLRIGNVADAPIDARRLAIWLKADDLVQLIRIGSGASRHPVRSILRHVRQCARLVGQRKCRALWLPPGRQGRDSIAIRPWQPQATLPPDPVGDWYQGGTFCSDEFDHGIERAPE